MAFALFTECALDFQRVPNPCGNHSTTWRTAWVVFDKLSERVQTPVINFAQVPLAEIAEQLENSIKKHTLAVQQDTKMPVNRSILAKICYGDPSETKWNNSGFMRIIDNHSNDKQFGVLGQLLTRKTRKELEDCPEFHETLTCPQFAKDMCVYLLLSK